MRQHHHAVMEAGMVVLLIVVVIGAPKVALPLLVAALAATAVQMVV